MPRELGDPNIYYHKASDRYCGQITIDGQRKTFYGKKKQEVREKIQEWLSPKHTLYETLDRWLEEGEWAECTQYTYQVDVKSIKNTIPDIPLKDLTPDVIARSLALFKNRTRQGQKAYLKYKMALNKAVEWGWLEQSPMGEVDLPKHRTKPGKVWTMDQIGVFLQKAKSHPYYPLFTFILHSGLRIEEFSALRWGDVNWELRVVSINKTLQRIGRKWVESDQMKTTSSRRTVHLSSQAIHCLQLQQELHMERFGEIDSSSYIFQTKIGTPVSKYGLWEILLYLCRKLGLPKVTTHSFRHMNASLALQAGVPLTVVSKHLGHSNPQTTASIYAHCLSDGGLVAEALSKMFP